MQTHDLIQGSPEWLAHRANVFNASEAPAMMGASKYTTRAELLHQKHTGITPDVSPALQALFDKGHAAEAAARPMIEDYLGDDLAPQVGTVEIEGMTLGASFDGITMMQDTVAEVKLWNEQLAEQVRTGILDMHYVWQLEQELLVSGAGRVIFVTTDGTPERFALMEYYPVPGRRERLLAGWKQFAADLATYTPPAAADPKPTGHAPEALPALRIEVSGAVTASNLADFKAHALAVFAGINRTLTTDAQFADAEKTVKWCADVEDRLKAAKQHALSQTESIDALFRAIDDISAEARTVRLDLDRLVKARKEAIRSEIVAEGISAFGEHYRALNARLGGSFMPHMAPDFGGKIKGLKSVDSIRNAVQTELARAKIEASATADRIDANLKALPGLVGDRTGLTPDLGVIVLKPAEDFAAQVRDRVAQQQAQEERRAAELAERERARIRAEEAARLQREEQERVIAETKARAAAAEAEKPVPAPTPAPTAAPAPVAFPAALLPTGGPREAMTGTVVPMPTKAPPAAPSTPPTLKLGQISERLGFTVTADFLGRLGFQPAATDKAAKLYHEADFGRICDAMIAHIRTVQHQQQAA